MAVRRLSRKERAGRGGGEERRGEKGEE